MSKSGRAHPNPLRCSRHACDLSPRNTGLWYRVRTRGPTYQCTRNRVADPSARLAFQAFTSCLGRVGLAEMLPAKPLCVRLSRRAAARLFGDMSLPASFLLHAYRPVVPRH
ncbi:hypothetical protein BDY21DRAFT_356065 [Lineolata rhizophorae]|uniref:Uncharacterized protein n=1 Tax=Lineolata rhizophorae TaxID=578093 RepID=A0A6A6NP80_9PEZI|nr:hypothetical protein BDY21DRAFT_356065 [Lineolata rhizophorae]